MFIIFLVCLLAVNTSIIFSQDRIDSIRMEINKLPDNPNKAGLYIDLVFSFRGSKIDSMEYYIELAEKIIEKQMDSTVLARIYNAKGNLYRYHEKNDKALGFYIKSLEINRKINNIKEQINNLGNIGQIYLLTRDHESALKNAKEVLNLSNEINYRIGVMHAYKDIGYTYFIMDSLDLSLQNYNFSIKVAQSLNDELGEYYCHLGKGEVYFKKAEYDSSLINFTRAYDYCKSLNFDYLVMVISQKLGILHNTIKNYQIAKDYLYESAQIAQKLGMQGDLKAAYDGLSVSYENVGNYKLALRYSKEADIIEDTLLLLEQTKILKELDNRQKEQELMNRNKVLEEKMASNRLYQLVLIFIIILFVIIGLGLFLRFKEKNKINKELEEKNNKINQINNELEISNSTKDKFFSIISHDLKGPLGSFNNLINLMVNSYEDFTDEERKDFLVTINESSSNVYALLENLLEWSRSQRNMITFNPVPTDIRTLAITATQALQGIVKEKCISITNNLPENLSINLDPKLIQTVLRNLISNSIKYTAPNGSINIDLNQNKNLFTISVNDTGVGIEEDKLKKLFILDNEKSTYGTNNEKGTGLGLLICKDFVELHNGTIWAESKKGIGSTFYFTIPN